MGKSLQRTSGGAAPPSSGPHVTSVAAGAVHDFSKAPQLWVRLLEGLGVEGDAHCGTTVRHRFARRRDPELPNLRQVHLIPAELFDDLAPTGHVVRPGDLGENVTTVGVDLLALPTGTELCLGAHARVRLTGLRTPCRLIDGFQPGLMKHMWTESEGGERVRRAGVMAVVVGGGTVAPGDPVEVGLPPLPHHPLLPV